jgi:hypothetical protein
VRESLPHPDAVIALAWLVALAVGTVLCTRDVLRGIALRRKRFNVKARAVLRSLGDGTETMKDRETKLPPIL